MVMMTGGNVLVSHDDDDDDCDMIIIFLLHNMWSHKEDDVKLNIDTIHIQSLAVCVKHFAILSLVWCPNVKSGSICVQ